MKTKKINTAALVLTLVMALNYSQQAQAFAGDKAQPAAGQASQAQASSPEEKAVILAEAGLKQAEAEAQKELVAPVPKFDPLALANKMGISGVTDTINNFINKNIITPFTTTFEKAKGTMKSVLEKMKDAFDKVKESFDKVKASMQEALNKVTAQATAFGKALTKLVGPSAELIGAAFYMSATDKVTQLNGMLEKAEKDKKTSWKAEEKLELANAYLDVARDGVAPILNLVVKIMDALPDVAKEGENKKGTAVAPKGEATASGEAQKKGNRLDEAKKALAKFVETTRKTAEILGTKTEPEDQPESKFEFGATSSTSRFTGSPSSYGSGSSSLGYGAGSSSSRYEPTRSGSLYDDPLFGY